MRGGTTLRSSTIRGPRKPVGALLVKSTPTLAHLLHPHPVAVAAVAGDRADQDLEVDLAVGGMVSAQVPWLAGGSQQGPGDPELEQPLARDDPDPLRPPRKISLRSTSAS